jgi:asparagine synthase (glutamine-hydrolysing)
MCAIIGLIGGGARTPQLIERLAETMAHRGPDGSGAWSDQEAGIAFGHRRLAIIDPSPLGHQPMTSNDGRWVITYNGEIYNHLELRAELSEGRGRPKWRGHSDTETLLEAIARWGLEPTLARLVGMFAFGLWDRAGRKLYLVRDRFGEKPLHYGWVGADFLFASELKAMRAHPDFSNEVSRQAVQALAARTHVPAPLSIYRRIFKLPPGCLLEVDLDAPQSPLEQSPQEGRKDGALILRRYWSYAEVLREGLEQPIGDEREAAEMLDHALARSVKGQAIADVPVGAFLSGGIDSSAVAAFYQQQSRLPVHTFTIGFEQSQFNEADHARAVARHLGTVHHEQMVSARDAADVIPRLPAMFDEPFGDSSAIPTFLVSRFARQHVTVALSGDGGDELFAGYGRYREALALWRTLRRLPLAVRRAGAGLLGHIPFGVWSAADALLGTSARNPRSGKILKGLRIAGSVRDFDDLYAAYLDQWPGESSPARGAGGGAQPFPLDPGFAASPEIRMMYCDAMAYLPDDILCKVDRASMAVGLESRVPFLDHRVAELAARIPMRMKLGRGSGKKILRDVLSAHVPRALFERPKSGFSMPLGDWLRGDLRDWAEDLLDPRRMRDDGFFDPALVQQRWQDNLARRRNAAGGLWAILMFQAWLRADPPMLSSRAVRDHAA